MPALHIRCPHCSKAGKVRDAVPGRRLRCSCGKALQLPQQSRLWLLGPACGLALAGLMAWLWLTARGEAQTLRDGIEGARAKQAETETRSAELKKKLAAESAAAEPTAVQLKAAQSAVADLEARVARLEGDRRKAREDGDKGALDLKRAIDDAVKIESDLAAKLAASETQRRQAEAKLKALAMAEAEARAALGTSTKTERSAAPITGVWKSDTIVKDAVSVTPYLLFKADGTARIAAVTILDGKSTVVHVDPQPFAFDGRTLTLNGKAQPVESYTERELVITDDMGMRLRLTRLAELPDFFKGK